MKEEFLHYLWKYSLYDADRLLDDLGNKITVINPGEYNRDSGPDFFNARLIIDGTEWAGNIEIHIRSSDFDNHHHNSDPAFNNVILHVVAENDRRVFNARGDSILTSTISFDQGLYEKYTDLVNNPLIIACQGELHNIDRLFIRQWLGSLVIERLQDKSVHILELLASNGNDWDETFYRLLTRYFGFRVNTEPFEMLASALPFRIIRKHSDNRFQIEALLFGTAGLLDEGLFPEAINDDYYIDLVREYRILSAKYSLKPVHGWLWKFSRLRPANFPTLRISQLAEMLSVAGGVFSKAVEADSVEELRKLFGVEASEYWDDHFVFGRRSRNFRKNAGSQATDILLINAIIPVLFVYARYRGDDAFGEKVLRLLEDIDPESNVIIRESKDAGINAESAFITQGLIQLRNNYCRKRKCLDCRIGNKLLMIGGKLKDAEQLMLEP
jgi:hypothetical protein